MCNRIPLRSCGGVFSIRFAKADRMIVGIEWLRTGNDQVVGLTRQSASSCQSEPITLNLRRKNLRKCFIILQILARTSKTNQLLL
jgi:hypothetical protein